MAVPLLRFVIHVFLLYYLSSVAEHVYILLCRYTVPNLVHINIAHGFIRRRVCLGAEIYKRHAIYFSGKLFIARYFSIMAFMAR